MDKDKQDIETIEQVEESVCQEFMKHITTLDRKQNYLIQKLGELHSHVTCLYELQSDVTNLPDASGHVQMHQLACMRFAKMLDRDFYNAGISYWIGYKTLIGALQRGKFLPWENTIDLCLMRPDYDRAVKLLTEKYNYDHYCTSQIDKGGMFQLFFLGKPCINLFPWERYYMRTKTYKDNSAFCNDYTIAMDEARKWEQGVSEYNGYTHIINDLIMHGASPAPNGDLFEGIDWQTHHERLFNIYHNGIWRQEWIFPLRQIKFCGYTFPMPNNPDAWLTSRYGDWDSFEPDFTANSALRFTYEELDILQAFINGTLK